MNKKLSTIVVMLTPFDEHGTLDEVALRRHLRRLGDAGVSVYLGGSGCGEGYALTSAERDRLLAIGVEELKGKVPVYAMGCEPRMIGEMVDFLHAAERAKVDAAQVFSLEIGHGAQPTVTEMERYYTSVIEATALPLVLSSHQSVGYLLPLDLIGKLLDRYPSIKGIACTGPNVNYLSDLIERFGDRVEIHCGGPNNALTTLGLGGSGFMGNEGNLAPNLSVELIHAFAAGDRDRLRTAARKLMALYAINLRYGSTVMRGLKQLQNAFGLPGGYSRPPRAPLPVAEVKAMVDAVERLEIPGLGAPISRQSS